MPQAPFIAAVAATALALGSGASAQTIYQLAGQVADLSTLKALVDTVGSVRTALNSSSVNATVFAPNNAAFAALGPNVLDYVTNAKNVGALTTTLLYHVNTTVRVLSSDLPLNTAVTLLTNNAPYSLSVNRTANGVFVNTAQRVLTANVLASNGVVHVINGVLVPSNFPLPASDIPTLASSVPDFSSLVSALSSAGLVSALTSSAGIFTVFAPNNAAFAKLLTNEYQGANLVNNLKSHVFQGKRVYSTQVAAASPLLSLGGVNLTFSVEGPNVYVNGISKIIAVDTDANNGVIHTLDTVIGTLSIYDLAIDAGLSTLVQLVNAAGIAGVLLDTTKLNALTVFAPTNAAFSALGENVISWVSASRNRAALTKILTYHVATPAVWSRSLTNNMQIATVEGQSLTITTTSGVKVNGAATVVTADVNGYNGAVHVIDGVLVPSDVSIPSSSILAVALNTTDLSSLVSALQTANLASVFNLPNGPYTVFAPVNSAFAALNPKAVGTTAQLTDVLTYHVVSGRYYAEDLDHLLVLPTLLAGANVTVDLYAGSTVQIKSAGGVTANVIAGGANIDCANGVVHLIDAVLLPSPVPSSNGAASLRSAVLPLATAAAAAAGVAALFAGLA